MLNAGLRTVAKQMPNHLAIVYGNVEITYGSLEAYANKYAHFLRSYGLVRGDHICCLLTNGWEFFPLAWAAYRSGLYLTPVPATSKPHEALHIINDCRARMVIATAATRAMSEMLQDKCPLVAYWACSGSTDSGYEDVDSMLKSCSDLPISDESPGAMLVYTSGIRGLPRGVWRPLLPADYSGEPPFAQEVLESFDLRGQDVRFLLATRLSHAASLRTALTVTSEGGTVYMMNGFHADAALNLLESERITHSLWIPSMFQRCLALPKSRRDAHVAPFHRAALHGTLPCSPELKKAMIDWWGPIFVEYYGGTEGIGVAAISTEEWLTRPKSVGRARRGRLHILDDNDNELPVGGVGRVFFSGSAPFQYINDAPSTKIRTSSQGYQTLGDVGYVDKDGYLYLSDKRRSPM